MRDSEGVEQISLALYRTGAFQHCYSGIYPAGPDPGLDTSPSLWIHPTKWSTKDDAGDDPIRTRKVLFQIQLYSKGINDEAGRLCDLIEKTVHGLQFLDSTQCRCESGDYHKYGGLTHPTHILSMLGFFEYIVP